MPGLLRGVARTAVIAGTATSVSNRVSRRQANRWSAQDASSAEAPVQSAGPSQGDQLEQLKELGELKSSGVLTEQEFQAQKAKILGG
jgi:Short C-terminal domain